MAMQIICPQCQSTYSVPEAQDGKRVKCKKCETVFVAAALKIEEDPPPAKEIPPKRPRQQDIQIEEEAPRRRRPEERSVGASRRDRYQDHDEDDDYEYRPRSRKASGGGISVLGIFLIIGGVIGSLVVIASSIFLFVWLWNASSTSNKNSQPLAGVDGNPRFVGGGPLVFNGNPNEDDENPKEAAPNEGDAKQVDPPPPPPKELVFISPIPKEAANAPKAPANIELAQEVVEKVKKSTVHLRVTMGDGAMGQGSGFFAVESNVIITNAHVVGMMQPESARPKSIEVVQNSGARDEKKFPAELLGVDRFVDLAVLRVKAPTPPAPLEVKSAENLRQTQRVWVVGFPFGDQLGKEVTVSDGTVSSMRRDDNGILAKVQVKGDMQPGNSGGPLIDALGNVVGVNVSILRGTSINFAVPGEWVNALATGRIWRLALGQPYVKEGNVKLPITFYTIDPLKRIRKPVIEVWAANSSPGSRPPSITQPAMQAGDTPHERQPLEYKDEVARGDVTLPPLPPGSSYWIQPAWGEKPGEMQWATAQPCELPPPVEQKPILLTLKQRAGSRNVALNKWLTLRINDPEHGQYTLFGNEECQLTETIQSVDAQEQANLALHYRHYNMDFKVENQSQPRNEHTRKMLQEVKNLKASIQVDSKGNPAGGGEIEVERIPQEYRNELALLHGGIELTLEDLMIPFPNKWVSPGDLWQGERKFTLFSYGGAGVRQFPFSQQETLLMNYTYLGSRKQEGREEAVVGLKGQVFGGRNQETKSGATAEGTAVIDLSNGQITEADVFLLFDKELPQFSRQIIKANGSLRLRIRRTAPSDHAGK